LEQQQQCGVGGRELEQRSVGCEHEYRLAARFCRQPEAVSATATQSAHQQKGDSSPAMPKHKQADTGE